MDSEEKKKSRVSMLVSKSMKSMHQMKSQRSMKFTSRVQMRRPSFGYGGVPGVRPVERTSMVGAEYKRPMLLFLNTYQLDSYLKFHCPSVIKATDELLDELFADHKYNVQESPALAIRIAGELMRAVKAMSFNRYRIITIVTLAQKRAQSYYNAITFLWDHERDNYVNVQRELTNVFIQVTVFGVYLD